MNIADFLHQQGDKRGFSFEVLPPLKGNGTAALFRTIDALKAFDTIYVITQGGPGTASETINIFLYLQAFAYYNLGYASAVVVVFFTIIIMLAMVLLWTRARVKDA